MEKISNSEVNMLADQHLNDLKSPYFNKLQQYAICSIVARLIMEGLTKEDYEEYCKFYKIPNHMNSN